MILRQEDTERTGGRPERAKTHGSGRIRLILVLLFSDNEYLFAAPDGFLFIDGAAVRELSGVQRLRGDALTHALVGGLDVRDSVGRYSVYEVWFLVPHT